MLLLSFWILFAYCVVSNALSESIESVEKHHNHQHHNNHQHPGFSSNYPPPYHAPHAKPVYGWYVQPPVGPENQGNNNYPWPQGNFGLPFGHSAPGGYGQQPSPTQLGPNGYQGQQPPSGYGFPPTGGYSPNVPFSSQTPPNFQSHGFQGFNPGYHANHQHPHPANHGQQPPFAYGGQQQAGGYHSNSVSFGPQQPSTHGAYYPNYPNTFSQQPPSTTSNYSQRASSVHGAHGEHQPNSGWYQPNVVSQQPSTANFASQDQHSSNRAPGIQAATGGYGPDAINPSELGS